METWLIIVYFFIVALMRVAQKVCSKQVSKQVAGKTFIHYCGYYNLISCIFAFFAFAVGGFKGINWPTVLCALMTGLCLAIELFANLEALKGTSLIVAQMFSVGGLVIPCLVGDWFFNEKMSLWQWLGLLLFAVAMYFMVSSDKTKEETKGQRLSLKTIVMLVVVLLAGGGTMVAQKVFGKVVVDGNVATYSFLMFAINALIFYTCHLCIAIKERWKVGVSSVESDCAKGNSLSKTLLIFGAILAFAVFVINMLVTELGKHVDSAILFSVSYAISIIMTILVGAIYYKEKLTWKRYLGIALCVAALAIINFL